MVTDNNGTSEFAQCLSGERSYSDKNVYSATRTLLSHDRSMTISLKVALGGKKTTASTPLSLIPRRHNLFINVSLHGHVNF